MLNIDGDNRVKTGEQRSKQTRLQRTTFRAPEAKSTQPWYHVTPNEGGGRVGHAGRQTVPYTTIVGCFKVIKLYTFFDRKVHVAGQQFHQEDLYMYLGRAFSMETKFNFRVLQTTICLEVKEVDVMARNGIQAHRNAKVGFFFSHLVLQVYLSARTVLWQLSSCSQKEMKKREWYL